MEGQGNEESLTIWYAKREVISVTVSAHILFLVSLLTFQHVHNVHSVNALQCHEQAFHCSRTEVIADLIHNCQTLSFSIPHEPGCLPTKLTAHCLLTHDIFTSR